LAQTATVSGLAGAETTSVNFEIIYQWSQLGYVRLISQFIVSTGFCEKEMKLSKP
jgi:hypothetical protein